MGAVICSFDGRAWFVFGRWRLTVGLQESIEGGFTLSASRLAILINKRFESVESVDVRLTNKRIIFVQQYCKIRSIWLRVDRTDCKIRTKDQFKIRTGSGLLYYLLRSHTNTLVYQWKEERLHHIHLGYHCNWNVNCNWLIKCMIYEWFICDLYEHMIYVNKSEMRKVI